MRLARPSERLDGDTPQAAVQRLGQALADVAADLEGRPRRAVPQLEAHAFADQLVVLTRDVLAAAGRAESKEALADDVHQRLVALRRSL